jgi:hypothetical protein
LITWWRIRHNKLAIAFVHPLIQFETHCPFPILRVKLVDTIQLSITIVHNTTSSSFSLLKGMAPVKVVPKLMCENIPVFAAKANLVDTDIPTRPTNRAHIG